MENTKEKQKRERYPVFDWLKCLCAFLVVCAHAPFPGKVGEWIICAASREAVPVFLMITGFFYVDIKNRGREKDQIIKIIKLIIWSNLMYFVWKIVYNYFYGDVGEFISGCLNLENLFYFIFFNKSPVITPLYYLNTILYVLLIVALFDKIKTRKILYFLIPLSMALRTVLANYYYIFISEPFNDAVFLNYFFVGLPYFLLGDIVRDKKDVILNFLNKKFAYKALLVILICVALSCGIIKNEFFGESYMGASALYHILGSAVTWVVFCLPVFAFIFALSLNASYKPNLINNALSTVGRKYSTNIYIFHVMVLEGFFVIKHKFALEDNPVIAWLNPIIVFLVSLLIAYVIALIEKKIAEFKKRKNETNASA